MAEITRFVQEFPSLSGPYQTEPVPRLRHNSLPIDQRDPGEFPCSTKKPGFTFCHKTPPKVRIVTYGLPKNLARFFVKKNALFACSSGSHGRFYVAKRQGYVAKWLGYMAKHNRPWLHRCVPPWQQRVVVLHFLLLRDRVYASAILRSCSHACVTSASRSDRRVGG